MVYQSPYAMSVCPKVAVDENRVVASSSLLWRLLTFGLHKRTVIADAETQSLIIDRRLAWFFHRKHIVAFSQIVAVTYGYEESHALSMFSRNEVDHYFTGVRLASSEEVRLFSFVGEGEYKSNGQWTDWESIENAVFGNSIGGQEGAARNFVRAVSKLIGVPIQPSSQYLG